MGIHGRWPTRIGLRTTVFAAAILSAVVQAAAQSVAPSQLTPPSLRPAPARGGGGIVLPSAAPLETPDGAAHLSVTLHHVEIDGGFPEMAEPVRALIGAVVGKRVTVAHLYALATAIEQTYARAGYVLARIVVPAQALVDGGTLRLVVVDGFIEDIDATAVPERARRVVEDRLAPLIGQRRVTLAEIERRVLLAGDVPGLRLRSTLARGHTDAGTRLVLDGTHRIVQVTTSVDNRLKEGSGRLQFMSQAALSSLTGLGEQVYATTTAADDLPRILDGLAPLRVWGVGGVIPLGRDGLTLNPEYSISRSHPIVDPGALETADMFKRLALRLSYPIVWTRAEKLQASLAYERIEQVSLASAFDLELSHDRYEVLRFGAEAGWATMWGGPITVTATFSHGLGGRTAAEADAAGVPLSRQGAEPQFEKLQLEARHALPLPLDLDLSIAARGQTSFGAPLLKPEQLALDTSDVLSGFDSGTFSVDRGVAIRAELGRPVPWREGDWAAVVTPYVFGAAGRGWIEKPTALERTTTGARSFGAGFRVGLDGPEGWPGGVLSAELARHYSDDVHHDGITRGTISATARF